MQTRLMNNRIEVHNFNFFYGDFQALIDLNLDIAENQITALIGPSGCGKSTFLRCAQPHERHHCRHPRRRRSAAGRQEHLRSPMWMWSNCGSGSAWSFSGPIPFPQSIYDNVAFGPRVLGMAKNGNLDEIVRGEPGRRGAVGRGQASPEGLGPEL